MSIQTVFPVEGTYVIHSGYVEDYAAKWAFGYIVALRGFTVPMNEQFLSGTISDEWIRNAGRILKDNHVGTWVDDNGELLYVDVWKHIDALSDARAEAKMRKQKYIYSLRDLEAVAV